MAEKSFNTRIQNKKDTLANWESNNPVLKSGEIALVELTDGDFRIKIGDGSTAFNSLPYFDDEYRAEIDGHTHTPVSVGGIPIVEATSEDGIAYTATLPEITELTRGRLILFIPNMTTKSTSPTLNINGLGDVTIRRKMSSGTATLTMGNLTTFFYANRPSLLMYDTAVGTNKFWVSLEFTKPSATDLYGYVPVQSGGTYVNSSTTEEDIQEARTNLNVYSKEEVDAKTASSDTGWVTLTPGTGVTASRAIQCRKIGSVVYIRGSVALTDLTTAYMTLASDIPSECRPTDGSHMFLCPASGSTVGRISISTAGVMQLQWIQPIEATYTYVKGSLDIDYEQVTGSVSWLYINTSYIVD